MENTSQSNNSNRTSNLSKLEDWQPEELNEFALKVTKYYKNQTPYKSKEPFTDTFFPPKENSLLGTKDHKGNSLEGVITRKFHKKSINIKKIPDVQNVIWLRASEIFEGKKFAVFESSISTSDVNQGKLSNSYFLSSLAQMCQSPQILMQIFRTPFVTENSCYEVIIRLNGVWKVVMLDDYFPCDKNTRKPIFAQPSGNEIWVMLLEKAWAKVNGGYYHIAEGFNYEVWESFTNFPSLECNINVENDAFVYNLLKFPRPDQKELRSRKELIPAKEMKIRFWEKILVLVNEKAFLYSYAKQNDNGIELAQSYTLIDAKERKVDGKTIRLIKLINPSGCGKWEGDWSYKSPKWTEEAKEAFEVKQLTDDDCFYMSFASYLEHFDTFGVCYYLDPICSRTLTTPKPNNESKVYVSDIFLPKNTHLNLSLFKKSHRFNKNIDEFANIFLSVLIAKKSQTETNLVFYEEVYNNNLHLRTELDAGNYLVFYEVFYGKKSKDVDFYSYDKFRKITLDVAADNFFEFTYIGIDSLNAKGTLRTKHRVIPAYFPKKYLYNPVQAKEPINSGYSFLGRNIKFKSNPYIVKLDPYLQAVRYYSKKNPKEMSYLNKLEKIKNRDNGIRPKDTNFVLKRISRKQFYLGEAYSHPFRMNGPGLIVYSDEGLCYGYFKNNKREGWFTYIDKGIERNINFNNDKPEGLAYLLSLDDKGDLLYKVPMVYSADNERLKGTNSNRMEMKVPNSEDGFDYLWDIPVCFGIEAYEDASELEEIERIDLNDGKDIDEHPDIEKSGFKNEEPSEKVEEVPSEKVEEVRKPSEIVEEVIRTDSQKPSEIVEEVRKPSEIVEEVIRTDSQKPSELVEEVRKPSEIVEEVIRTDSQKPSELVEEVRKPSEIIEEVRTDSQKPSEKVEEVRKPSEVVEEVREPSEIVEEVRKPSEIVEEVIRTDSQKPSEKVEEVRKPSEVVEEVIRTDSQNPSEKVEEVRKPSEIVEEVRKPSEIVEEVRKPSEVIEEVIRTDSQKPSEVVVEEVRKPSEIVEEVRNPSEVVEEVRTNSQNPSEIVEEVRKPSEVIEEDRRPSELVEEVRKPSEVVEEVRKPSEVVEEVIRTDSQDENSNK